MSSVPPSKPKRGEMIPHTKVFAPLALRRLLESSLPAHMRLASNAVVTCSPELAASATPKDEIDSAVRRMFDGVTPIDPDGGSPMRRLYIIANPQEYAGSIEGASPSRFEPTRLPPPVGPLHFALAAFAGAASWLVVLAFVALLRWLS